MITICVLIFPVAAPLRWEAGKREREQAHVLCSSCVNNQHFFVVGKIPRILSGREGGGEKKTEETRKDSDKIFPLLPRDATVQAPVSEVQKDRADTIFWPTSQMGHTGSMDCTGWEEDKEF